VAEVRLPRSLVSLFPGMPRHLDIAADDLAGLVATIDARYPGFRDRVCDPGPRLREHVNVFVDGRRAELDAPLAERSVVHILPAISGGAQDGEADVGGVTPAVGVAPVVGVAPDGREYVHPETATQWHAWLAANHARPTGVWLVAWKTRTGRPRMGHEAAVEEALAWGWVDSTAGRIDEEREAVWMSPRRKGSGWSRSNKERIARLEAEGRLMPAGRAAVEQAMADGSWTRLDEVEDLVVPPDLAAAFEARPGARARWDGFSRSVKRAGLAWIVSARRPETRERRVNVVADAADRGERVTQWPPR
jgi:uncharacterized protein YdeI (YjbR/CyaY-like superfamily)/molybdopterin converting factor small subunit